MRVIGGRAKGHRLYMVPGDKTRPMMDRIKENLFNLLGPNFVPETRWLDLFAGTGQVGIEALSRGAAEVVFLDTQRDAIRTIHGNLRHTGLTEGAKVIRTDAFTFLRGGRLEPFDVIFVAPPQYHGMWIDVLDIIDERPDRFLTDYGMVIVQVDPEEFEELDLENLEVFDQRTYGRTMLCFYEAVVDEDAADVSESSTAA